MAVRDAHIFSRGPTPVRPDKLTFYLQGYNNRIFDFLIKGFLHGFSIQYFGSVVAMRSPNLKSALDNPASVNDKLSKELTAGRIVGPFDVPPFETFRISPQGVVPKKSPGEFRLIHHLSYPAGSSVNDGIPKELATVPYAIIDDAIRLVKSLGNGCFLAKTDIKSPFRIIPITPRDFPLLGIEWQGKFYFDKCLPMGCFSSCQIFDTEHRVRLDCHKQIMRIGGHPYFGQLFIYCALRGKVSGRPQQLSIVFFSDNQAVVEIINRQTSKDRSVMVLLRRFVLCTLKYNILFQAKHIAG